MGWDTSARAHVHPHLCISGSEWPIVLKFDVWLSVKKLFSRSKFTEQIFTPQSEHNFQLRAQIILLLRVAEQFM